MKLAHAVKDLLRKHVFYYTGAPVDVVEADTCIGGVQEAARAAEKFKEEGVGVSITVTPCWCYGSETMDMDPHIPKAVWGFIGTEGQGVVYLEVVLAAYNKKGLVTLGFLGMDVQDVGDVELLGDGERT